LAYSAIDKYVELTGTSTLPEQLRCVGKLRIGIRTTELNPNPFPFHPSQYERFPELEKRGMPGRGPQYEFYSLAQHAKVMHDLSDEQLVAFSKKPLTEYQELLKSPFTKGEVVEASEDMRTTFPNADAYLCMYGKREWMHVAKQVLDLIENGKVNRQSSPGFPYCQKWQTNGAFIDGAKTELLNLVMYRLWCREEYMRLNLEKFIVSENENSEVLTGPLDADEMLRLNLCDPTRIFIKDEPHTQKKINNLKHRIINSVSIVDGLIQSLLYTPQNKAEIANWYKISSKPGIGFENEDHDQLIDYVINEISMSGDFCDDDSENWDWLVKYWERYADAERRITWANLSAKSWFGAQVLLDVNCITSAIIATSDGICYQCTIKGRVASGEKNTSATNSFLRTMISKLIAIYDGLPVSQMKTASAGDDHLHTSTPNYYEIYSKVGHTCKEWKFCIDSFDFCSHQYFLPSAENRRPRFLNFGKTMTELMATSMVDAQMLTARAKELRFNGGEKNNNELERYLAWVEENYPQHMELVRQIL